MQNNKNIILATVLSAIVLLSWTWFFEKPRMEEQERQRMIAAKTAKTEKTIVAKNGDNPVIASSGKVLEKAIISLKNREEILEKTKKERVEIASNSLHGSISLKGARFDDLTLAKYFTDATNSKEVVLFAPSESKERYFADFGWISSDKGLELPTPDSIWHSNSKKLTVENPVVLSWKNKAGIEFIIKVALDENYMFSIEQSVKNHSAKSITLASYGRINRILNGAQKPNYILHEGAIGVASDVLQEVTYKDLIKEKQKNFSAVENGWLGITDKYWLSSIIPDKNSKYAINFSHNLSNENNFFNSEFIGQEFEVAAHDELKLENHMFAGAKKVKLLDAYSKEYNIKLFDRAIDFGWFYFLTKPFYFMISFLNKFLGNFGLAILVMTVLIKLALFPMANKSYAAIAKIKKLQPKMDALRERFKDDKIALNREIMGFYKKEGVNPASGCLPILIQIPVFFALYKVIFVTLDMRHAPFYGWIHDLSAPDPTSIFNLFGLLPFEVSHSFTIGIWPILMGITMILQQKLSPQSADPTQAKILKFMPYVLTFVLAAFPAGLVIYWTWSNTLSILQQWLITKKLNKADEK